MPYLIDNHIKTVFQLGDLFDKRRSIDFLSLAESKRFLFKPLQKAGINFHTILGNHDLYYRESLSINSTGLLLGEFDNIHMYDKPTKVMFDETSIDVIPWICKENELDIFEFMCGSKSDLCFGHFAILGFSMQKGMKSHEGISTDLFAKYEKVFSGHFHTRSDKENILYVGTPYDNTYADLNDPKGFHIFDTETRQTEFIKNPYTMFIRHEYDDVKNDYNTIDMSQFHHKYVKIVVTNKTDFYMFDKFLKKLYDADTYEIKILEDLSDFSEGIVDTEEVSIENTLDVLEHYVDSVTDESNQEKIKTFMKSLYLEALEIQ
jgi:DNA repair exonuclease SbcCD nuclease subunit